MADFSPPETLLAQTIELRKSIQRDAASLFKGWKPLIRRSTFRSAAWNLAHYLALQKHDPVALQRGLMPWGLSLLQNGTTSILPHLEATIASLGAICRINPTLLPHHPSPRAFFRGERLLKRHAHELFGDRTSDRLNAVTLPPEGAEDAFFLQLLQQGATVLRIDSNASPPPVWQHAIAQLRQAEARLGRTGRVWITLPDDRPQLDGCFIADRSEVTLGDRLVWRSPANKVSASDGAIEFTCTPNALFPALGVGDTVTLGSQIETHVVARSDSSVALEITAIANGETAALAPGLSLKSPQHSASDWRQHGRSDRLQAIVENADILELSTDLDFQTLQTLLHAIRHYRSAEAEPLGLLLNLRDDTSIETLSSQLVQCAGRFPLGVTIDWPAYFDEMHHHAGVDDGNDGAMSSDDGHRFHHLLDRYTRLWELCQAACIPTIFQASPSREGRVPLDVLQHSQASRLQSLTNLRHTPSTLLTTDRNPWRSTSEAMVGRRRSP